MKKDKSSFSMSERLSLAVIALTVLSLFINQGELFSLSIYFYLSFIAISVVSFFVLLYVIFTNHRYKHNFAFGIIIVNLLMMFVFYLVSTVAFDGVTHQYTLAFLIAGFAFFVVKFFADISRPSVADKCTVRGSYDAILVSFISTTLAIIALFIPMYFSNEVTNINGIDVFLGTTNPDMPSAFETALRITTMTTVIITVISFIVISVLYFTNKKFFLKYNIYHIAFSFFTIFAYAVVGMCYVYALRANGVNVTTLAYIPLTLLLFALVGIAVFKMHRKRIFVSGKGKFGAGGGTDGGGLGGDGEPGEEKEEKKKAPIVIDPIPAFGELDRLVPKFNAAYEKRKSISFPDLTLPKLVDHVIDYARRSAKKLSYGPVDIKTFIAGLAASRLSILQGMSGTGKTSLPVVFMEAIEGTCDLVAVESSWRDKNELLGYFNEFSGKFTPKIFTQFLYKAALNKEVPTFIILDEMNLSRIEYYFSDFLSLMEAQEHQRFIKLFDVQLYPDKGLEYKMLRDGHTIDIPTNVWFIGTANRDESTFEISDKVYDRAQTMNFDKRAKKPKDKGEKPLEEKFVAYSVIDKLFKEAEATIQFNAEADPTIKKIEELLKPYQISFGNRILNQMERFVKIYIAASGTTTDDKFLTEAIDCIMLSKVIRKLEYKMVEKSLVDEFAALNLPKCEEFLKMITERA